MKTIDIRTIEWDTTNLRGGSILAHICPICAAQIPHGNDYSGISYRERHTRYHEFRNEVLRAADDSERIEP